MENIFPNHSGVYVIWKDEKPIYVGETSGLKSRMSDLMRPINHAFTKKINKPLDTDDLEIYFP
ncbi:MAG: GIY-YIG nuclease family protein, partial [Sulfurospirillum sp.]|nr:GIY-YIG nuclease family protein [Sulfurospirillum sp.]